MALFVSDIHDYHYQSVQRQMVILSTVMSYQLLTGLFTGSTTGAQSINGPVFMQGFHNIFVCSAAISAIAIICSSLRGNESKEGKPSVESTDPETIRARA